MSRSPSGLRAPPRHVTSVNVPPSFNEETAASLPRLRTSSGVSVRGPSCRRRGPSRRRRRSPANAQPGAHVLGKLRRLAAPRRSAGKSIPRHSDHVPEHHDAPAPRPRRRLSRTSVIPSTSPFWRVGRVVPLPREPENRARPEARQPEGHQDAPVRPALQGGPERGPLPATISKVARDWREVGDAPRDLLPEEEVDEVLGPASGSGASRGCRASHAAARGSSGRARA